LSLYLCRMAEYNPMTWENCFSSCRTGASVDSKEQRTDFQRDYDRLIFSSAFRRLQNKTQVFPLPGSTFVHNRLTHSLEVSSVGRSLGKMAGQVIAARIQLSEAGLEFYLHDLPSVIAAACLAHDIGNPAFGHSGEDAISSYFRQHACQEIAGSPMSSRFSVAEWKELCDFEGNANAFRILTHHFSGKSSGGYRLTYATLAATMKYPCLQQAKNSQYRHTKKYGFFISELETMNVLAKKVHLTPDPQAENCWFRHPFVYLTEAADDICYRIIDLEDAHRLGIVGYAETESLLLQLLNSFSSSGKEELLKTKTTLKTICDANEKTAYLRAKVINRLIQACTDVFADQIDALLSGKFELALMDEVAHQHPVLGEIEALSVERIYSHDTVVHIELAGYHVISKLLDLFVPAVLTPKGSRSGQQQKAIRMLPLQYLPTGENDYENVRLVLDYISGMTDLYATEFYQNAFGFAIPKHR